MRLLLDTHVVIRWRLGGQRLSTEARMRIASAEQVFVSSVSAWEFALLVAKGRVRLDGSFEAGVEASGFTTLSLRFAHAEALATLPPHHGNPFDRMLIAQAQVEQLVLVTADRQLEPYGVPVLWA